MPCCKLTGKVLRQVARCVQVLHLPRKHIWQVKFLRKLRLFALLQPDGKSFKASCSPCSGFSFATKVHLASEISADVAFCLPCCKNQRHQTLNATDTYCNYRHVHGNFVAVSAYQVVAKNNGMIFSNCAETNNGMQSIIKIFQQKKQPEKVAFVFVYKSLYCTNSTPASLMRCAANSSG